MKISCIIPTCNRTDFLIEAIQSALEQTYLPEEVIVVNNGEGVLNLPLEIAGKVKVLNIDPFVGVSRARNEGVKVAQGDWLAFLDDDDLWSREYLEKTAKVIEDGAEFIVSRLDVLRNSELLPYKNAHEKLDIQNLLIFNPGITGSNIIIKKDLFVSLGGFDQELITSEDKSLAIEYLKQDKRIKTLPDNFVIHREHKGARLSNSEKMAEGIRLFLKKYSGLMTWKQRAINWKKIYMHRRQLGQKRAILPYFILKVLTLF